MLNDVKSGTASLGRGIEHLKPEGMTLGDVQLSIVIPAMNEEVTVGEFIEWCKEGLKRAGVTGQILIVDSSTDNTPKLFSNMAARSCAFRSAGSAAPTWTPFRTSAESGC